MFHMNIHVPQLWLTWLLSESLLQLTQTLFFLSLWTSLCFSGNSTETATVDENTHEFFTELTEPGTYRVQVTTLSSSGDCEARESAADTGFTFYLSTYTKRWRFKSCVFSFTQEPSCSKLLTYVDTLFCVLWNLCQTALKVSGFWSRCKFRD